MAKQTVSKKKKVKKIVTEAIAHVNASFNNTLISLSDMQGNVFSQASAGEKFKGSRKSTPYAAQIAAAQLGEVAKEHGVQSLHVHVKGPGSGRESAVRGLASAGMSIQSIKDQTPIPHNGARANKRRRV